MHSAPQIIFGIKHNFKGNLSLLILSYLILSYLISSYLILSYLILSYLILSYLILSYLILSYLILSYLILSYLILSYLILSYLILSYLMPDEFDQKCLYTHKGVSYLFCLIMQPKNQTPISYILSCLRNCASVNFSFRQSPTHANLGKKGDKR